MKVIINNIPESIKIIQSKIDRKSLSVFCGAGISVKSGIPTVIPLVNKLLVQLGCDDEDITSFLRNKDLPIPFEAIIQSFKDTLVFEKDLPFLPEFVKLFNAKPNSNHHLLAGLFEDKKINKIVTTNFDNCIEKSYSNTKNKQRKLIVYSEHEEYLRQLSLEEKLIKIHGSVERPSSIGATVDQITKTEFYNKNQIVITKILASSPAILFLGYSCSDKWDVTRVFSEFGESKKEKPKIIFWQHYDLANAQPTENQKKIFKDYKCTWMTGDTDQLIAELGRLNSVSVPNPPYLPANYTFENLTPKRSEYVLGNLFHSAGFYKLSIKYLKSFVERNQTNTGDDFLFASAFELLAESYRKYNEYKKSRNSYLFAISLVSESKNVNPKERAFILARLNTKFGMLLLDNKKKKPANEHMAEALSILKPFRNVRLNVGHKYQMAETYNDYAYLKHDEKKYKEAEPYWEFSLKLRHSLSKIYPQRYLRDYSASLSNLGSAYYFTDRYDLAIDYCSRAISVTRELAEINPTVYLPELAQKLNNLGAMYREKMDRKMAVSTLKEALTIREKLAREEPMIYLPKVAYTLINLSVVYQKIPCNKQISLNYLDKAVSIIKKFKRKAAINKYFDNIEKILLAWQIDPKKYFRDQSSIFLNDRS